MLHLLFICGGEKNKRMRGQKTRSETLKRWGKVLTCEQLKPRRAAIWIQTGGRETLYSTVCRSAVSTERAELWFCLISWRDEQVAQIRERLLQNNNQKIGKSEWSDEWMVAVIMHHTAGASDRTTRWRRVFYTRTPTEHQEPARSVSWI